MQQLVKLEELLHTEVSRKEFLRHLGIIGLTIIGVSSVLQNLEKLGSSHQAKQQSRGYGSSAYGK